MAENKKFKITKIKYFIVKLVVFSILAILILIFRDQHVEHLKPFIGSLMLLYGVEEIFFEVLFHHKHFIHESKTYLGLIELIFGIVLIVSELQFDYVCIIWATWSIVRESYELKELVADFEAIPPKVLSGGESVLVIVFSVLMLMNPTEHHAILHVGLLVVELILSPLVMLIDECFIHFKGKKGLEKEEE